jgi:hypothetical protein
VTEPREITDGVIQGVVFTGPIPESDADTDWRPYEGSTPGYTRQGGSDRYRDRNGGRGPFVYGAPVYYADDGGYMYEDPYSYQEQDIRSGYDEDLADVLMYGFRYRVRDSYQYATPEQMVDAENRRAYGAGLHG